MNQENSDSKICPTCRRPTHKESKYCIFHAGAEEKTKKDFKQALKKHVNKIKKRYGTYNFKGFVFIGRVNFKDMNIDVLKNANFSSAVFNDGISFDEITFKNDTNFTGCTFERTAFFKGVIFQGYSDFTGTIFKKPAVFASATFEKESCFRKVIFEYYAHFNGATFKQVVLFEDTVFGGGAHLKETVFGRSVYFEGAVSKYDIYLESEDFAGDLCFHETKLFSGKKLFIKTNNIRGEISFEGAYLENSILHMELAKGTLINFTGALLRNTKINKDQIENHILQEKEKDFSEAQEIYLLLKNNFHSIGQYEDESWAFKKEKDMERKSNCNFKTLHKWLWSCFLNGIYGYGEKPERVFLSAILIILIFACVFMNYGITSPPLDNLPKYNILKELSMGILYGDLLNKFKAIPWEQVKNCLYFSTVTFTTLGLGDFRPVESWGKIFVGSEAFIGAFMMALFVYTFARKTGGR